MTITTEYGVDLTVQLGLATPADSYSLWGSGRWGTARWGPGARWVDVTEKLRSATTHRAFGREVAAWEAGTATVVLDDRDGRFSPDATSGPYVVNGTSQVRPWRDIRILAGYGGVTYPIWRGYIRGFGETYDAVTGPGAGDAEVTLECVDTFGWLARFDGVEGPDVGGGELFGERLHRVLDNARHRGGRDIHTGNVTMQATNLSKNTVTEMKLTADSEGGAVYVGPDGTIIGEHNYALIENERSNSVQVTWGDSGLDAGEMPYEDVATRYDSDQIVNIASFARVGSTAQTVTNEASRSLNGPARSVRTDLVCETDDQARRLAQFELLQYARPERRVSRVDATPLSPDLAVSAALWPVVLDTRVRDLHRVKRLQPGSVQVNRLCHVAGIHHTISLDDWQTSFDMHAADVYQGVARWGHARWGRNKWFV